MLSSKITVGTIQARILIAITKRLLGFGFEDIKLAYAGETSEYNGRFISEIAETEGGKRLMYLNICEDSDFKARVLWIVPKQRDRRSPDGSSAIHLYDGCLVRRKGVQYDSITIVSDAPSLCSKNRFRSNTIHRMTGKTTDRFRIPERGFIEGLLCRL